MLGYRSKQSATPQAEEDPAHAQRAAAAAPDGGETFDPRYYLTAYSDVRAAGVDPKAHFFSSGWREGRNPVATFDTVFYRLTVSGLAKPDLCPLTHYNQTGAAAGVPVTRAAALTLGAHSRPAKEIAAALPDMAKAFDADFYLERYADVALQSLPALEHFLTTGWREGRNPSARFDTIYYRERFQHMDAADICPVEHYLRYGSKAGLPTSRAEARARAQAAQSGQADPSTGLLARLDRETVAVLLAPRFSAAYYLGQYPDIAGAGVDPFWHYIGTGWREGRRPAPGFDPDFYVAHHMGGAADICPLLHHAVIGRMRGLPTDAAGEWLAMRDTSDALHTDALIDLMDRLGFDASFMRQGYVRDQILPLFSASHYRAARGLGPEVSDVDAFLRYLALDLPGGMPPGPVFSAEHYTAECARRGVPAPVQGEKPLHHWLRYGTENGVSPNPAFLPEDYLRLNPDLAGFPGSLFGHFIRNGMAEGRAFSRLTPVAPSSLARVSGDKTSRALQFLKVAGGSVDAEGGLNEMHAFLASGRLEDTIRDAALIDPDVGGLDRGVQSMIPPWHDSGWAEYAQVLKQLPSGPFDTVVLMPFCKLGGADFVAGVLTQTLAEGGRVLVLRTDAADWARPDWFPANVATADLSAHLGPMNQPTRMRMLYEVIVKLRPKAVYNVNSRLAFDTFERYGERLALLTRLHAYYFCADRTPEGIEAGYPVWYFSNILPHLTLALIDNAALAQQLIDRFSLTGIYRDKVRVVYTPAISALPDRPVAAQQLERQAKRARRRILWAGRLDAQKRFDLVKSIADLLPDVDFDCWGKAVLDAPPDVTALPPNLTLHDPFKTYDDLPLRDADGWLYTSGWDGMPTILIELAALGLPIVGSAVGGVPELLDETTGWPLGETATAADYANAIKAMLADPEGRLARATALQDKVRQRHDRASYSRAILADVPKAGG